MLLDAALELGAELIEGKATVPIIEDGRVAGVEVETGDGKTIRIEAKMVLDCSGQASFLANRKATGPKYLGSYDKQIAIFSHLTDFVRDEESETAERKPGNTHIFYTKKYHWAWGIPVDPEVTSVGVVVPSAYFREQGESKQDF